ncbi:hypothetical protein OK590_003150 [Shigella flexneri]|nr:hypothetical protein [Salmonella enterica]EJR2951869.1 hypothetical protein [Salmonella enterica]EKA3415168.1 hypothetical protein [Shigella flexneri]ELF4299969.1 hypothetical protein [Shigella flexneri]
MKKAIKLVNAMLNRTDRYFRRARKDAKEIAIIVFEHIDRWSPKYRCFATENCFTFKEGLVKHISVRHIENRVEVNAVVDAPADFTHNVFLYNEIHERAARRVLEVTVILHTPKGKQVVSYP